MSAVRILLETWGLLLLASCASQGPSALPASSDIAARGVEERVISYVNASRASIGEPPLTRNAGLDSLARELATRLANEGRLNHAGIQSRFARARANTGATRFAENAHHVPPSVDPARQLVGEWLASKTHRKNILNRAWNLTGIATTTDSHGMIWAAQVFASAR